MLHVSGVCKQHSCTGLLCPSNVLEGRSQSQQLHMRPVLSLSQARAGSTHAVYLRLIIEQVCRGWSDEDPVPHHHWRPELWVRVIT
jgi:hypothetical protein